MRVCFLLFLVFTSVQVEGTLNDVENWDCGADKFWISKFITQRAAESRCSSIIEELNRACRYHDFCYSNGIEGQASCDDKFCTTLLSITIANPYEKERCTLPLTMCNAVRVGGGLIYQDKSGGKR